MGPESLAVTENQPDKPNKKPLLGKILGRRRWETITRAVTFAGIVFGMPYLASHPAVASLPPDKDNGHELLISDDSLLIQPGGGRWSEPKNLISSAVPNFSDLRPSYSEGLKGFRIIGTGSESEIGILFLGDKFSNDQRFLGLALSSADRIFTIEPFASSKDKFAVYALSTETTPSLDCSVDTSIRLCNDRTVRQVIDSATIAFKTHFVETIVLSDSNDFKARSYIGSNTGISSRYAYAVLSTGAFFNNSNLVAHELLHGYVGLVDEYNQGFPPQKALPTWPNCVPVPEITWIYLPENPGRAFPGCHGTDDGYRDLIDDIMNWFSTPVLGPADLYWTKKVIGQGLSRYQLFSLRQLPRQAYLTALYK